MVFLAIIMINTMITNYNKGDSYFFAEMRKNPLKYIFKRENDVKKWLLKLRDTGTLSLRLTLIMILMIYVVDK